MAELPRDDSRGLRLYTTRWHGGRDARFHIFRRDFAAGAEAEFLHEDDYSILEAVNDTDQGGGDPNAPAMPANGQAGHAAAMRRMRKRQAVAFYRVYSNIEDERLKEMMNALPHDGRRGTAAWQLLIRECSPGQSDLEFSLIRAEFEQSTIDNTVMQLKPSSMQCLPRKHARPHIRQN